MDESNLVVLEGAIPDRASDDGDGAAGRDPGRGDSVRAWVVFMSQQSPHNLLLWPVATSNSSHHEALPFQEGCLTPTTPDHAPSRKDGNEKQPEKMRKLHFYP